MTFLISKVRILPNYKVILKGWNIPDDEGQGEKRLSKKLKRWNED